MKTFQLTTDQASPFSSLEEAPDPLDDQVVSEKIKIMYPDYLGGCVGQARLVEATPARVRGRVEVGEAILI